MKPRQKWEDTPGLEHHCPICTKPLNNPGALKTCIGSHAVVCWRFHHGLHMRGHAHECKPCRDADRRHEIRHREIAEAFRALNVNGVTNTPTRVPLSPTTAAGFNIVGSPIRTAPSQRRNGSVDENDNMMVTLKKREKKEIKRALKAVSRNQAVTTQEVERIWKVLHPEHDKDAPLLKEDAAQAYFRQDAVPDDEDIPPPDFTDEVERILRDLKPNGFGKLDKDGKATFKDLKDAVGEDLVQFYQEGVGIALRREGYLRWVGRSAIKRDLENYEERDWKTGARISSEDLANPPADEPQDQPGQAEDGDHADLRALFAEDETRYRIVFRPGKGYVKEAWQAFDDEDDDGNGDDDDDDSDSEDGYDEENASLEGSTLIDQDSLRSMSVDSSSQTSDKTAFSESASRLPAAIKGQHNKSMNSKRGVTATSPKVTSALIEEANRTITSVADRLATLPSLDDAAEVMSSLKQIQKDLDKIKADLLAGRRKLRGAQKRLKSSVYQIEKQVQSIQSYVTDSEAGTFAGIPMPQPAPTAALKDIVTRMNNAFAKVDHDMVECTKLLFGEFKDVLSLLSQAKRAQPELPLTEILIACVKNPIAGARLSMTVKAAIGPAPNELKSTSHGILSGLKAGMNRCIAGSSIRILPRPTSFDVEWPYDGCPCGCSNEGQDPQSQWGYMVFPKDGASVGPMPVQHANNKIRAKSMTVTDLAGNVSDIKADGIFMKMDDFKNSVMLVHYNLESGPMAPRIAESIVNDEVGKLREYFSVGTGCIIPTVVYDQLDDNKSVQAKFADYLHERISRWPDFTRNYPKDNSASWFMSVMENPNNPDCECCKKRLEKIACMCGDPMKPGEDLYDCAMASCGIGRWHLKCLKRTQPMREMEIPRLDPVTNRWVPEELTPGKEKLDENEGNLYCPGCLEKLKKLVSLV